MNRLVALAVGALVLGVPALGWAQGKEPDHFRLVRGLQDRGDFELALQYLEDLAKRTQPPLPGDVKSALPLEIAKCQAYLALNAAAAGNRDQLLDEARASFQKFIADPANKDNPLKTDAQVELAKLIMEQGRAKMFFVRHRAENDKERETNREHARKFHDEAEKLLADATKTLETRKDDGKFQAAYWGAVYNRGLNLYEKAIAFGDDPKFNEPRSKTIQDAIKVLDALDRPATHPILWQRKSLLARCYHQIDTANKRDELYAEVAKSKEAMAIPAQRMLAYWATLDARVQGGPQFRQSAEAWLKSYGTAHNSPEGLRIRYELGLALGAEIQELQKQKKPVEKPMVDRALELFEGLETTRSLYAPLAEQNKFGVLLVSDRVNTKKLADLNTFPELYIYSQLEASKAGSALDEAKDKPEPEKKKLEDQAKEHMQNMVTALRRAVTMIPENVNEQHLDTAYRFLYQGYAQIGDFHRAAVMADHWSRVAPKVEWRRDAALFALRIYRRLVTDPEDIGRVVRLGDLIVTQWPESAEANDTRDLLARVRMQDCLRLRDAAQGLQGDEAAKVRAEASAKLREAAKFWEEVTAKHPSYAACSYLAGTHYWMLYGEYIQEFRKANTDPNAKPDKNKPELQKAITLLDRSVKAFAEARQKDPTKPLDNYHAQGILLLSELHNYMGGPDAAKKTLDQLQPLLAARKGNQLPEDFPPQSVSRALRLALSLYLQQNNLNAALDVMKSLGEQGSDATLTQTLTSVGLTLQRQMADLAKQGPAAAAELEKTRKNYENLLGQMEAQRGTLTPDMIIWLADGYASLNNFGKAIPIYESVKEDPNNNSQFRRARLRLFRVKRDMAGKESDPAKRKEAQQTVAKELGEFLQKHDWAKRSAEFRMERIFLVQDQGDYGTAITQWESLIDQLKPNLNAGGAISEAYHQAAFWRIYCLYKEGIAVGPKDPKLMDKAIYRAANEYVSLKLSKQDNDFGGPSHRKRFEEFLADPQHRDFLFCATYLESVKVKNPMTRDGLLRRSAELYRQLPKSEHARFERVVAEDKALKDLIDKLPAAPASQ